jgi:hypothetical protein
MSAKPTSRRPEQAVSQPVGGNDECANNSGHRCSFRFSIIARTAGVASLTTLTAQVKAIRISGVHEPVGGPVFGRNGDGLDGGDGRSILHLPWANST